MDSKVKQFIKIATIWLLAGSAEADDWPMWRYDAGRSSHAPLGLSTNLHLHWTRQLPKPRPAWLDQSNQVIFFDHVYEPVVKDGTLFVGSMTGDRVTAYDANTGEEKWRFHAEGPVRFAPLAHRDLVLFVSDDGYLYAVGAADGQLRWKFRGAPTPRKVIGNGRLISTWPARGAPVVYDDKVYFAAGIWPFMGIFLYALDANTGEMIWRNSGSGSIFVPQPHKAPAFAGVAPQGYLAADRDHLVVSGGRSMPAVYRRKDGAFLHFKNGGIKKIGHYQTRLHNRWFAVAGEVIDTEKGVAKTPIEEGIFTEDGVYRFEKGQVILRQLQVEQKPDSKEPLLKGGKSTRQAVPGLPDRLHLKAGPLLIGASDDGRVAVVDISEGLPSARLVWQTRIEGEPGSLVVASDRLFVSTLHGRLFVFGEGRKDPVDHPLRITDLPHQGARWENTVRQTLAGIDSRQGYAVCLGIGSGGLIRELLDQSGLRIIAVDRDAEKVRAFRRLTEDAGLYGNRVEALTGDPFAYPFPPYLAHLIVSEDIEEQGFDPAAHRASGLYEVLRPYGGMIALTDNQSLRNWFRDASLENAGGAFREGMFFVKRKGALPGAGTWTHQYGNAGNTLMSGTRVKAPLGLLWFGGPPNDLVLPRHGHGPAPQVAQGRLFIEGAHMLRAVDVYNGQVLWEKPLKDFGAYYNTTAHFTGANEIGGNYVSTSNRVYAVLETDIVEIDAATGDTLRTYSLTPDATKKKPYFGHVCVEGRFLVATSSPLDIRVTPVNNLDKQAKAQPKAPPVRTETLIEKNGDWLYRLGPPSGNDWKTSIAAPKNGGWKTGKAGFGFGDDDDQTILDMRGKHAKVYIRTTFPTEALNQVEDLRLKIRYDDAFVAYLNGHQVAQRNLSKNSDGAFTVTKRITNAVKETIPLNNWKPRLNPKQNVLSIVGYNINLKSSDLTLDPYLVFIPKPPGKPGPKPERETGQDVFARAKPVDFLKNWVRQTRYASGSRMLTVFDRHTGERLWQKEARHNFRHNTIAAGGGRLFCIDGMTPGKKRVVAERGFRVDHPNTLYAFDLATGREAWSVDEHVQGTFLNYSEEQDVLVQAGSKGRDWASDESPKGISVYRGRDGVLLWQDLERTFGGPLILRGDKIITNGQGGKGYDLLTGKPWMAGNPVSGKPAAWTWSRNYGCNNAIASEHLMTFRSGAAAFYDLDKRMGTSSLGGFKSGCTSSLIPADGVLNAPDYTRSCVCGYQNQTSLALVHMPEVEMWTFQNIHWDGNPAERIGVNLGAPGDGLSDDGAYWLEHPVVGGPSPNVPVKIPEGRYFRHHATLRKGPLPWVCASGVEGAKEVTISVVKKPEDGGTYTVRLYAAENDGIEPGQRVFAIALQGNKVLEKFDIAREAGGTGIGVMKEFKGIAVNGDLKLTFTPTAGSRKPPLLCGIEIIRVNNHLD